MTDWCETASDEEIVQRFIDLHRGGRRSVHGVRAEMLKLAPRLYGIMLDGLESRQNQEKNMRRVARDEMIRCNVLIDRTHDI